MRRACLLLLWVVGSGCDEEFKPGSVVEKLRVLGARAEPAEIRPGQVTALEGLIVDPSRAAPPSVFWVACDPDPYNLNRTACSDTSTFADPTALDLSGDLPPGMRFIGLNNRAGYQAPPGLFDVLPAGDPRREEGTVALILMLAIAEEVNPGAPQDELAAVFARVRNKETAAVIALFRVQVSEKPVPNHNPRFAWIHYGDEEVPARAHLLFRPEEKRVFTVAVPDDAYETYRQDSPTGASEKVERMQVAWYGTSGRFSLERQALDSELLEEFTAPGFNPQDFFPADRKGTTWAVLRDSRGGFAWHEQPFYVCDDSMAHPRVTRATGPASAGASLVLEGENLGFVVDVLLGDVVVEGAFSSARGTWEGVPKGVAAGEWPVSLRSGDCSSEATGLKVTVP